MSDRRMIYPYTFVGKIRQFPFEHYLKFNNSIRGVLIAFVMLLPLAYKMQQISLSEESYKYKAESRKRELEEIALHREHLL